MIRILKYLVLAFIMLGCFQAAVSAQAVPYAINLELAPVPKDDQGTDVRNMYTVRVSFDANSNGGGKVFNVLCSVDDVADIEFKDQALPFTFERDFRGLAPGAHILKIEIENIKNKKIISSNTVNMTVVD